MSAVLAEDIHRAFGTVTAVDGASLEVASGEVVGLVGANGAGKTTLIRVILGLVRPDAGRVELAGGAPSRATRRRVGYVPQGLGLWTDLTLDEHLQLAADAYGAVDRGVADEQLASVAHEPVARLPLGLRRRAAFTVALAHRPEVLLLDEPTSGVDALARSRLWDTIRATASGGAGVLVSTHYLDEAARCDRVVLMSAGRVVASGTVDELLAERRTTAVRAARWEEAWSRLEAAGLDVLPAGRDLRVAGATVTTVREALDGLAADVEAVAASLDEVFLTVTAA